MAVPTSQIPRPTLDRPSLSAPGGRRHDRDAFLQCTRCKTSGTARRNRKRKVIQDTSAVRFMWATGEDGRRYMLHTRSDGIVCGLLITFDTEGEHG